MSISNKNRYNVLDPDLDNYSMDETDETDETYGIDKTNKTYSGKFIRRNLNDDLSDDLSDNNLSDNNLSDNNLSEENDDFKTNKWKHTSYNDNIKYKSFNTFCGFSNQKKNKMANKDIKNKKKLLCNNVITNRSCGYNNKCMYAHSLEEQQIDVIRKAAYDILFSSSDLSNINFQENITLYKSLKELTKLCDRQYCTGGYNCKHGICGNKKYQICIKDLEYGDCNNQNCNCVHLTKRGLKPYYVGTKDEKSPNIEQNIKNNIQNNIQNNIEQNILGTLLTIDFFKNTDTKDDYINDDISSISSDDSSSVYSTDECDQSIFDE